MPSTPELPRTSSWSRWPTSLRASLGPSSPAGTSTEQQRNRAEKTPTAWKRCALPLSRPTTATQASPPRSAQEQQGRKNSHNGVSAAW
jgi:hypothetical protein